MMFSESFSYYNTYNGTKRHCDSGNDFPHRKRRLVDHLSELNLGRGASEASDPSVQSRPAGAARAGTTGLFGNVSMHTREAAPAWNSYETPTKVFISNIDQFLRENPERLDFIGSQIEGPLAGDLFVDKSVLRASWEKIVRQCREGPSDEPTTDADHLVRNLVWKEYVNKYLSLVAYCDPHLVLWKQFVEWQQARTRGLERIKEVEDNGDEMMVDDTNLAPDFSLGTSQYGSYYGDEHPWDRVQAVDSDVEMD